MQAWQLKRELQNCHEIIKTQIIQKHVEITQKRFLRAGFVP
jgi:hypothetical protein